MNFFTNGFEKKAIAWTPGRVHTAWTLGGAGVGAGAGYLGSDKKDKLKGSVAGAVSGGMLGYNLGTIHNLGSQFKGRQQRGRSYYDKHRSGYGQYGNPYGKKHDISDLHKTFDLSGKEKTKAEVKKKWREQAMKHHPDRGGNAETFKDLNNKWDDLSNSDWFSKLAMRLYKTAKEHIVGGKADGRPDSDFDKKQLEMGRKIEREHTKDPAVANEVAKDHLTEFPDSYYTELNKMESKLKKAAFDLGFCKSAKR